MPIPRKTIFTCETPTRPRQGLPAINYGSRDSPAAGGHVAWFTLHRGQDLARRLPEEGPCNPASKHRRKLKIGQHRAPQHQLPRGCENHSVQVELENTAGFEQEFEHPQMRAAKNAKRQPLSLRTSRFRVGQ